VSSAGLLVRGGMPFRGRDPDYHTIPAGTRPDDLAEPDLIEPHARELAGRLKRDKVSAVLLAPV